MSLAWLPRELDLVRLATPDDPVYGTAISREILERVASGRTPATARLQRTGPVVSFGRQDSSAPGFGAAVRAARAAGFACTQRLAGGRAAIFHEGTLAFSIALPDPDPRSRTRQRFELSSTLIAAALRRLGVDARVGEVAGEYCPGSFSVNARGQAKLAGLGQRLIDGGAHVGGVIVASDSERIRSVLGPVYEALGLDWDPSTAGSVADEVPGIGISQVEEAILTELRSRFEIVERELDRELAEAARDGTHRHEAEVR